MTLEVLAHELCESSWTTPPPTTAEPSGFVPAPPHAQACSPHVPPTLI